MTEHISREEYLHQVQHAQVGNEQRSQIRDYKQVFLDQLKLAGIILPVREHIFARPRLWRWDFAYVTEMIAIEYQGGIYQMARTAHSTVRGLTRDYEKFTEGSLLGWRIILIDTSTVRSGKALQWVERALGIHREPPPIHKAFWEGLRQAGFYDHMDIRELITPRDSSGEIGSPCEMLRVSLAANDLDSVSPERLIEWLTQNKLLPGNLNLQKTIQKAIKRR